MNFYLVKDSFRDYNVAGIYKNEEDAHAFVKKQAFHYQRYIVIESFAEFVNLYEEY